MGVGVGNNRGPDPETENEGCSKRRRKKKGGGGLGGANSLNSNMERVQPSWSRPEKKEEVGEGRTWETKKQGRKKERRHRRSKRGLQQHD